jgi:hypothetical protein
MSGGDDGSNGFWNENNVLKHTYIYAYERTYYLWCGDWLLRMKMHAFRSIAIE